MSEQHTGARHLVGGIGTTWDAWGVRWHVSVDWITDDTGKAVPVRLVLNGAPFDPYDEDSVANLPCTTEPIGVIRREVLDRLPLREILEDTRQRMIASGGIELPDVDRDAFVDTDTHVGRLTRAAQIHAEEVANGARNPSLRTWERLALEGVTSGAGKALTKTRVRTWVAEAKQAGVYPGKEESK